MRSICIFILMLCSLPSWCQELYQFPADAKSKVVSFENRSGKPGLGGRENKGAKGHPAEIIKPGERKELLNFKGTATIRRIWCTVNDRSPQMLRSLRLQAFWDGASQPAIDVPLGDFFGVGLGQKVKFESALFSDPEGRSFNSVIPMPFRKSARVVMVNESNSDVTLFYDIDLVELRQQPSDMLYFHAYWSRQMHGTLKKDFEILPQIKGRGRWLGVNMGVIADTAYGNTWWGEGEVKIYLDGDSIYPTINGTGTEDYIGTGWGMGTFSQMNQGCLVADEEKKQYAFYRYHIPDPVYFSSDIRVTIQQIGGGDISEVRTLVQKGAALIPVTVSAENSFVKLFELNPVPKITDPDFPKGWVNFYRVDDYSATAYFYLNKPVNGLPPLQEAGERMMGLR